GCAHVKSEWYRPPMAGKAAPCGHLSHMRMTLSGLGPKAPVFIILINKNGPYSTSTPGFGDFSYGRFLKRKKRICLLERGVADCFSVAQTGLNPPAISAG